MERTMASPSPLEAMRRESSPCLSRAKGWKSLPDSRSSWGIPAPLSRTSMVSTPCCHAAGWPRRPRPEALEARLGVSGGARSGSGCPGSRPGITAANSWIVPAPSDGQCFMELEMALLQSPTSLSMSVNTSTSAGSLDCEVPPESKGGAAVEGGATLVSSNPADWSAAAAAWWLRECESRRHWRGSGSIGVRVGSTSRIPCCLHTRPTLRCTTCDSTLAGENHAWEQPTPPGVAGMGPTAPAELCWVATRCEPAASQSTRSSKWRLVATMASPRSSRSAASSSIRALVGWLPALGVPSSRRARLSAAALSGPRASCDT
mmetsp:Transcript_4608/g.19625  ORF Transcript_4608/g.19625 Transcript_4608/m.19625 type:complete len:318 (-) Transcript_4608:1465-2418(-)